MATADVGVTGSSATKVDMVIVGGGICGIIAARNCHERGITYRLVERESCLGGNWHLLANSYSHLQAFEPNYRWDDNYRVNPDPLTKNSAVDVLATLNRFAADHEIPQNTLFSTEVVTVREDQGGRSRYRVICRDLRTGVESVILADYLCVTCGILAEQWTAEDRGVKGLRRFKGVVTHAGKHRGVDCAVGGTDLTGKNVVIIGSGSFAAEAMEAAERSNAAHITIVGRPRHRWILPFSRQYTVTAIANAPLLPWSVKSRLALYYLRKRFYEPCGLSHWLPKGTPDQMDYSGQCNDGYFRLAYEGRLTCVLDSVEHLEERSVVLTSGTRLPCDMLVMASGCKYNLDPPFLRELGLGFKDLHNFAFLGNNPRIGCASDFVFAYVPFGPIKQMEMYFHAVEACRNGKEKEACAAMFPTALPNHGNGAHRGGRMAGHHTFFEYRHWWSQLSIAQELRVDAMLRTMDVGRSVWGRVGMRLGAAVANYAGWVGTLVLAGKELWRYPVYGKGVTDHHHHCPAAGAAPVQAHVEVLGGTSTKNKHT